MSFLNPFYLLFKIDRLLARLEGLLLVFTLIVMLLFAALQVILRNFFDTGIEWGDVFARHLVLWVGFFGATLSTKEDRHIKIDALSKIMPKRIQPMVQFFVLVFCILVSFFLYLAAVHFMMYEKGENTILFANIPTWYFLLIMPLGFGIITFRYFVQLVEFLYKFAGKKIEPPSTDATGLDISVHIKLK